MSAETQYELVTLPDVFGFGRFMVPDYQRSYSWESEQRKDLLDDLVNIARMRQRGQDQRHFAGTIVAARPTGGAGEELEIVDGQQRLTSLVILIAELLRRPELAQSTITREGTQVTVREAFLKRMEGPGRTVRPLRLNAESDDYFRTIVLDDCPQRQDAVNKGHSNLADAKQQFRSWVNRLGPDGPLTPEAALDAVLHGMGFLFYAPARSSETGLMFEVINNRGKPLSRLEKVKNYLVYFATRHGTTELGDAVRQAWPHILDDLGDAQLVSNQDEDSFLRAAWIVFAYPGKSESYKAYVGLKEKWPPEDAACWEPLTRFVKFLQGAARSVRKLLTQEGAASPEESDVLTDLSCQGSLASVLPLVFAIDTRVPDVTERVRLLRLVERLNFRHYGLPIAKRSDTGQGDLFWWAHQCYDKWSSALDGANVDSGWLEERLTGFVRDRAPDVELVKALTLDHDESFDYGYWGSLNYFLARYEKWLKRKDRRSEVLQRLLATENKKYGKDFFHREHIWAVAEGSAQGADVNYHKRRLSNFVLLEGPLNISVSNKPVAEKLADHARQDHRKRPILFQVSELQPWYAAAKEDTDKRWQRRNRNYWVEVHARFLDLRERVLVEFALDEWRVDYDGERVKAVEINSRSGSNEVYHCVTDGPEETEEEEPSHD